MNVLHVINNLQPAGAEILLTDIAIALQNKGVNNEILTLFKYSEKALYRRLMQAGIQVHSMEYLFRYDIRIRHALKTFVENGRYDIIHANLFPAYYWAALSGLKTGKMVLTEHNTYNRRMGKPFLSPVERFVCEQFDSIVCISNDVLLAFSAWLPSLVDRMKVIYNGIQIDRFQTAKPVTRQSLGIPDSVPLCTMVSRFYRPKDHKTVIEATVLVPGLHVMFVGEGELEPAMREYAKNLGVDNRIHFLGYRNDVPSLLKASDVCLQSSYNEGFALSVAEAMASGIPVIASDVQALNEVVQNKISGLLFECGNPNDLADKILQILTNATFKNQLVIGGHERVKDFSIDNTATSLLSLYGSLL